MPFDSMAYEQDLKFLARFKKLAENRKMPKDQVQKAREAISRVSVAKRDLQETISRSLDAVVKVASKSDVAGAKRVAMVAERLIGSVDKITADYKVAKLFSTPSGALKMSRAISEGKKNGIKDAVSVAKRISAGVFEAEEQQQASGTVKWDDIESAFGESKETAQKMFQLLSSDPKQLGQIAQVLTVLRNHARVINEYSKWRSSGMNTDTLAALTLFLEVVIGQTKEAIDEMSFKASDGMTYKMKMMKRDAKSLVKFLDMDAGTEELRQMLKTQTYVEKFEQAAKSAQK